MRTVIPAGRLGAQSAQARVRREPVDVPESPFEDRCLDQVIAVHEHRLLRLEKERADARRAWREARGVLKRKKECWRAALAQAHGYWQETRAGFLRMTISSGEFRQAKARYERMKQQAAEIHLAAKEAVPPCRQGGQAFFSANRRLVGERKHIEKLKLMCDELKSENKEKE